jgi:hypothetical protein
MAAKKKVRTNRTTEEKQALVAAWQAAKEKDPSLQFKAFAESVGVSPTLLLRWRQGKHLGGAGGGRPRGHAAPMSRAAQPGGEWLAKHGGALKAQMGVTSEASSTETLVSSGSGEEPRTKRKYTRKLPPFEPRPHTEALIKAHLQQQALPYPEPEPLPAYEAQAERELNEASAQSNDMQFLKRALRRALRERDAAMVMLKVIQRESPEGDD